MEQQPIVFVFTFMHFRDVPPLKRGKKEKEKKGGEKGATGDRIVLLFIPLCLLSLRPGGGPCAAEEDRGKERKKREKEKKEGVKRKEPS